MTAIITGDIVNSRQKKAEEWLELLKKVLSRFGSTPQNWEVYRGDHFQLEVNVVDAFWTAIILKSYLKQISRIDVRMAIGIGRKSHHANRVLESNGTAFIHSGEAFDTLGKEFLSIRSEWKEIDEEMGVYMGLLSLVANSWTPLTALIVQTVAENQSLSQKEIASIIGRTQSNISLGLKRGGYNEITKVDARYRKLIKRKLEDNGTAH